MGTNPSGSVVTSLRLRKLLLLLFGAPAIVGFTLMLAEYKGLFDPGLLGINDMTLYTSAGVAIGVALVVTALVWRCPACHGYLGKEFSIARCPHCDVPFTRQAEESQS